MTFRQLQILSRIAREGYDTAHEEEAFASYTKTVTFPVLLNGSDRGIFHHFPIDSRICPLYTVLVIAIQFVTDMRGENLEIVVSNKASQPLYEQIASQIKAAIISGELKAGDAIPSVRSLAKSLHISILTVQKAYATLQEDGFIETTAGKGCYVSAQNQDFYLEEQQKKIEERFAEAIEIARSSGISLNKLTELLALMYQEDE